MKTSMKKLVGGIMALGLALPLAVVTGHAAGNGVPSSKVTFDLSELVLLPETIGTGDWVTLLCDTGGHRSDSQHLERRVVRLRGGRCPRRGPHHRVAGADHHIRQRAERFVLGVGFRGQRDADCLIGSIGQESIALKL